MPGSANIFTDPSRPFFQFADHMTLERIPAVELLRYVRGRFETSGRGVPDEVAEDIVAQAEGHPHFTQYFAAQAWDVLAGGAVEARELATAWKDRVVSSLDGAFRMFFDGLSTRQRRVLLHLASRGSEGLFSEEVRRQHGLGSSSSVSGATKALVERDVLEKLGGGRYRFVDPALRLWVDRGLRARM